jgi:phage minor structural protein
MIKVFGQTDTTFTSNGDVVLIPLKAKVYKADNGDYYLDLETSLKYVDYLVEGNIIIANTPQGDQAFRVSNVQKTGSKITTRAWHVFYDSKNYLIAHSKASSKTCDQAIKQFNNASEPSSEFTVSSDVAGTKTLEITRQPLYDAIMATIDTWGGHLVRDNFNIQIKSSIGSDQGVTVQYKKNLREITVDENWDDVVTKILPVGKDDTLLNAVNPSASIYIESSTQYDLPYCKTVSFEQDIEPEDYSTDVAYKTALVNDLRAKANAYLSKNNVPKVNYTLKAHLDRVTDIGDTIHVRDERLNLNLLTSVISYEYDCLLEKFTEIEFGNFKKTLSGLIPTITSGINHTLNMAVSGINDNMFELYGEIQSVGDEKQDLLVSGVNIKTINGQDVLGSGDLTIDGGVSDVEVNGTSVVTDGVAHVTVPTDTSDLNNDSDFVSDSNYVHTDNNFTNADVIKLSGIASGAEVNVQSDWNESDSSSDAYIRNKPPLADYIVEEGTDGIWRYRKWNSGISECWGKYTQTITNGSATLGGYVYTSSKISYPSGLFIEEPVANYSGRIGTGFCLTGTLYSASATQIQMWAVSQVTGSKACEFFIHSIGKWK